MRSTRVIDAVCPELDGGAASVVKTSGVSAMTTSAMQPNTTRGSTATAIVPITGPSMVPKVPAPIVMPSDRPRLPGEEARASQASPPPQMPPHPSPWLTRATSRTRTCRPRPKTSVAALKATRPISVRVRGLNRLARPTASAPRMTPAGYDPVSSPAAALERANS